MMEIFVPALEDHKFLNKLLQILFYSSVYLEGDRVWNMYAAWMTCFTSSNLSIMIFSIYYFLDDLDSCAVVLHHTVLVLSIQTSIILFCVRKNIMKVIIHSK